MTIVTMNGRNVELDEDGHLLRPQDWHEDVAAELARRAGIDTLTADHWRVMTFLREVYLAGERPPTCRVISKKCGVTPQQMFRLFPGRRPLQVAANVAGVPEPHDYIGGCGVNWWSPLAVNVAATDQLLGGAGAGAREGDPPRALSLEG